MTPDEWLANFETKVADMRQKAAAFTENLEASGATETSADGSLRVTVAPNGALTDLTIADSALRGSGAELAAEIMTLARRARGAAAGHVAEAFAPLAGAPPEPPHTVVGHRPRAVDDDDYSNDRIFGDDD
jgi:DNA-binding protein YbaB